MNPFHKPNTSPHTPSEQVYVLTLTTTPSLHNPLNALRTQHFPPHLNRTPAHITLFHALPHSHYPDITKDLTTISQSTSSFTLKTSIPFHMGKGVAINVDSSGVEQIKRVHVALQKKWVSFLSPQDRQAVRPHWTVQNKVNDAEVVDRTFKEVKEKFEGATGLAVGLVLWRYMRGGRWEFEREFVFGGAEGNV